MSNFFGGGSGGDITAAGSGTVNTLAKFDTVATTIKSSSITDDGTKISSAEPFQLTVGPVAIGADATLTTTKPTGKVWRDTGSTTLSDSLEVATTLPGDITGTVDWAGTASLVTFTPTADWSVIAPVIRGSVSAVEVKPSAFPGFDFYGSQSIAQYDAGNNTVNLDEIVGHVINAHALGGAAGATVNQVDGLFISAGTLHRLAGGTPNALVTTVQKGIEIGMGVESGMTATTSKGIDILAPTRTGTISTNIGVDIGNQGTGANDYALRSGTGNFQIGGPVTLSPAVRASGVASYFTLNIPADTGQTASTESIGLQTVTGTRTWATTGTVALQRENFFAGPTYASAGASQTFTDAFTLYATPPVPGTNAIITRGHTLGIVDSTSAASSITGGFIVATTLGTTATSVGIGGGNINAGGTITGGSTINAITGYQVNGGAASNAVLLGNGTNFVSSAAPLPSAAGGTANAFFTVSGPATSAKTFTFQNATSNVFSLVGASVANTFYKASDTSGTILAASLLTDNATTLTYTGTGGVSAPILVSTVAIGTAPLTVTSTTQVSNLNVSQLVGATWVAPSTIGSTTPNTGAFTTLAAGSAKFNVDANGLPTKSNNLTLAGQGYPTIVGITSQKSESGADANLLTVTTPAAGQYEIDFSMAVSAQNTATLGWTCTWTDSNGTAQSPTNLPLSKVSPGTAAPALTFVAATSDNYSGNITIDVNGAANIVVKVTFSGTSFTAKASASVKRII